MYDLVIRGGTIYDGSGAAPHRGDVAVSGDRIAAVGTVAGRGRRELDASGLAVAPGFINMLSWATESLIEDGRSQSDVRQGVTLEIFGEGSSMGPLTAEMKKERRERQGDIRFDVTWTTLGEYLDHLASRGISCNVGSFIGATTVRIHVVGYDDRRATPAELDRMRALVDQAMRDGALGVGSSLIYTPATFADTDELVALCEVAAKYGGLYTSHIRSEADRLLEAVDEVIEISRRSGIRAEIYHLKQAGKPAWAKYDECIGRIEAARAAGLPVTADMYPYTAGATGLYATMPPWVQEGGHRAWVQRLRDPQIRTRLADEMRRPGDGWENFLVAAGSPDNILLASFKSDRLKPLTGKRLGEVARMRGTSPEETAMDLVIEDDSRVGAIYFHISEDNVRRQMALPWVSFGSDAGSLAPEGVFLKSNPHPRAYGTFARVLGTYVRDEGVVPLEEAIRRLTSLPATNLGLADRGTLLAGKVADIVAFDAARIRDNATYEQPHQYATGMVHVVVNGEPVLVDGEHTNARPGRVVRGRILRESEPEDRGCEGARVAVRALADLTRDLRGVRIPQLRDHDEREFLERGAHAVVREEG
jgi:N-acyl-D-amino-acid deacylase